MNFFGYNLLHVLVAKYPEFHCAVSDVIREVRILYFIMKGWLPSYHNTGGSSASCYDYVVQGEAATPQVEGANKWSEQKEVCITVYTKHAYTNTYVAAFGVYKNKEGNYSQLHSYTLFTKGKSIPCSHLLWTVNGLGLPKWTVC